MADRSLTRHLVAVKYQVVAGNISNGAAIIRPPGHHAEPNEAMGKVAESAQETILCLFLTHKGRD